MSIRMKLLNWIVMVVIILVLTSFLIPPISIDFSGNHCRRNLTRISQAF